MELEGREATDAVRSSVATAPAAGASGSGSAVKKTLLALKRMQDDDDDSSSDDEPPSQGQEKGKPSTAVGGTRPPRSSATRKPNEKAEENETTKGKKSKPLVKAEGEKPRAVVVLNVCSERLQMRAALIESTAGASEETVRATKEPTAVTKEVPPPRKRCRAGSDNSLGEASMNKAKAIEKTSTKKRRLTRKESLIKKSMKEEAAARIDDEVVSNGGAQKEHESTAVEVDDVLSDPSQRLRSVRTEKSKAAVAATEQVTVVSETATIEKRLSGAEEKMVDEEARKELNGRSAKSKSKLKQSTSEKEKTMVKHRARAISEEVSDSTSPVPEVAKSMRDERAAPAEEAGDKKRNRLKRPLSAIADSGSVDAEAPVMEDRERNKLRGDKRPSLPRPALTERRYKTTIAIKDERRRGLGLKQAGDDARRGSSHNKRKEETQQETLTKLASLDDFLKMKKYQDTVARPRGTDVVKIRPKKQTRPFALNDGSLVDYNKEHEGALKPRKQQLADRDGENELSEDLFSSQQLKVGTSKSPDADEQMTEEKPKHEDDLILAKVANNDSGTEPPTSPAEAVSQVDKETTASELPVATISNVKEEKEEGAVSDDEDHSTSERGVRGGGDTASSVEESSSQPLADPLSFVIPKKRALPLNSARTETAQAIPRKVAAPATTNGTTAPGPSSSPASSVDMTATTATNGTHKPRTKNAVPPKMAPLTQNEKDFMRLAKRTNSFLKAATVTVIHGSSVEARGISAFGCTSDRYGVLLESGSVYAEKTTRMSCPTRKKMQNGDHPREYFGVGMSSPLCAARDADDKVNDEKATITSSVPCYETLEFERSEDRDWYQQQMYGTPFVPQLLRERVTLVMRNARYVRKSAGLHFNPQRDKEEFAAQTAERYKMNRSVPRCDILQKNWQILSNGRTTFVFLHYMNREDALLARAQFRDDEGQHLIIKGESRSELVVNGGPRPGMSPPPQSSPPPRRRSRSRSIGRASPRRTNHPEQRGRDDGRDGVRPHLQNDRDPWPPRDRSSERRRRHGGRKHRSSNGPDDRGGAWYRPDPSSRLPPRRTLSRSPDVFRQPESQQGHPSQHSDELSSLQRNEQSDSLVLSTDQPSQGSQISSQTITASQESGREEKESLSQGDRPSLSQFSEPPGRARSRSRPRGHDNVHPPPPHPDRRGSEDRSFQRDRRVSGEFQGRGRDGGRGRSPPPQSDYVDRDRYHRDHRDHDRYGDHPHRHHHHSHHPDEWALRPHDYDRRGYHESDSHRHPCHEEGGRRFY